MDTNIEVGKFTKVVTKDGRVFIGMLTGYAEVASGEEVMEEIYLNGLGKDPRVISLNDVTQVSQDSIGFCFKTPVA